jgi:hypothetical protein
MIFPVAILEAIGVGASVVRGTRGHRWRRSSVAISERQPGHQP